MSHQQKSQRGKKHLSWKDKNKRLEDDEQCGGVTCTAGVLCGGVTCRVGWGLYKEVSCRALSSVERSPVGCGCYV